MEETNAEKKKDTRTMLYSLEFSEIYIYCLFYESQNLFFSYKTHF